MSTSNCRSDGSKMEIAATDNKVIQSIRGAFRCNVDKKIMLALIELLRLEKLLIWDIARCSR